MRNLTTFCSAVVAMGALALTTSCGPSVTLAEFEGRTAEELAILDGGNLPEFPQAIGNPLDEISGIGEFVPPAIIEDNDGWTSNDAGLPTTLGAGVEERSSIVIYFGYNQNNIDAAERPKLEKLAADLAKNPMSRLVVEGHCDERGSDEFNRALGEDRALAVRDYLNTLGVQGTDISTVSYGEEVPAASGQGEANFAKNRRAEFVMYK